MPLDLEPGKPLGRYIIERLIGRGGMGLVFKIRDPKSKMPYAAKVLHPRLAHEKDFLRRFKTEAKIARRLKHMNVVHVFELKRWKGTFFYTSEFVDGSSLEDILAVEGRFSLDRSSEIVREVAGALEYVHSKRYVHRDIKPGNVLLRRDSHLKLADFGLAQKIGRVRRTRSNHVMGTAKYMAPELIEGTRAYPQTDVYALGVMAYELIAGRPPFLCDDKEVLMDLHLYTQPKPLAEIVPGTDRNLSLFVSKMLAKRPSRRVASATAVFSWFDFYLANGVFADLPRALLDL